MGMAYQPHEGSEAPLTQLPGFSCKGMACEATTSRMLTVRKT